MVTAAVATNPTEQGLPHTPRLHHPWFAGRDEGVTLHRYFDEEFVPRFVQEALSHRLRGTRDQEWYNSDRFGRKDLPTLRLPMHQTFYIACCEVSCDLYPEGGDGQPAFDPARIASAGFVVRRRTTQGGVQRWLLHEGRPLGWQGGAIPDLEPDDYRRLVNSKLLPPQYPEPSYSGEETYPLHSLLVRSNPASRTRRSHTLLWGYLPLGGSYRLGTTPAPPSAEVNQALAQELAWPFGQRSARVWLKEDSRPVFQGRATAAGYELLDLLLTRYRIFDAENADNSDLRRQLAAIYFHPSLTPRVHHPFDPFAPPPASSRGESLLSWLEQSRDALLGWLSNIAIGKTSLSSSPLPRQSGHQEDGTPISTARSDDLYISEEQARGLREALILRAGRAMMEQEKGLAMPRFGQSDDDSFFVVPFVRWRDRCGCERIHWGQQSSLRFRVVSPFDPEAQRPRAVVLPGLADLKRGAARGITLLAPKSLADGLRKIKPTMDVGSGGPGNPAGLCWSFSLSIPVVTICAMILLMILINLLNLFFGWLPWAIRAIPRLCAKHLNEENSS